MTHRRLGVTAMSTAGRSRHAHTAQRRGWVDHVLQAGPVRWRRLFRDVEAENAHPRIIDRETFDLAQRLILERGENPAADPDRPVTVGVVHEARRAAGRGQPRSRTR